MRTLNAIYMVVVMIVLNVVLASCKDGNENDFVQAPESTTNNNTPTPGNTTNPNTWTFAYDPYASMTTTGWVESWWHIVNESGKNDSICHAYQVKAELGDTLWLKYAGIESQFSERNITLESRHRDEAELIKGDDNVYRAHEVSVHTLHCGAYERTLNIDREYAKIVVKGFDKFFEFAEYHLENGRIEKSHESFTRGDSIFDREIDDLYIDFMHGVNAYTRHCVTVIDRFVKMVDPEEPETPNNPDMPKTDFSADAVEKVYSTITPILGGSHVTSWVTTLTVVGKNEVSVYDVNTKKLLAKGSTSTYKNVNTAVFVNEEWKLAYVEKGSNLSYVYCWGNASNESWTVKENLFCVGGAQNLQEDNSARQNPYVTVNTTHKDYANGTVYTLTGLNGVSKVIFTLTVAVSK